MLPPDAPAAILYTSGTTGTPKGAVLSHNNVISNVAAANHHCGLKHGDKLLLFVPLFHCFGQNAILNCALASGATIVLHRQFVPGEMLESIQQHRVTHFYGVPTAFIWLLNADLTRFDLSSIGYYFSAAAKLPVEIAQQWRERFGLPIYEGYGLTETSPFSSYNHESDYRPGSVGTPIQQVEMQIWDEQNHALAPGQLGEIVIKGPNVMLGYWKRPEDTANAMRGGWFHSGDIGSVDEDGYFYITDRLKDMINVSGLKVYPAEVENVLYQHPAVQEAAVYGAPDELTGEAVWANVVLKRGQQATEEELIAFCGEHIAAFKAPRVVRLGEAIPKNPTGKVLKRLLVAAAQMALAKQPQQVIKGESTAMERTGLFDILKTNIRSVSPSTTTVEIQESHNLFYDLRLDSLQTLEVVSRMSRQTQIRLPLTAIARVNTLSDLLELFQKYGDKPDEHQI